MLILCNGGAVMAHECIIRGHPSGTFFSSLLDGVSLGKRSTSSSGGVKNIKISLPYDQVLRMVLFIYTGMVTCDSDTEVQNDLINSHHFNIDDMKRQCESAINVTSQNAIDVLSLSIKVHSKHIEKKAIQTIAMNLVHYYKDKASKKKLQKQLSKVPHETKAALFEEVKDLNGKDLIIPKYRRDKARKMLLIVQKRKVRKQQLMTENFLGRKHDKKISVSLILRGFPAVIIYSLIMLQTSLKPIVPFVNVGLLLLMARFLYISLK